jgi:hypothetical protein
VRVLFGRNGAVAEIAPQVTVPRETPSAQRPSRSPELPAEPLL